MSVAVVCVLILLLTPLAHAETAESDTEGSKAVTGLALPRFATLRSGEVNMRTGPGTRYPIEWVFTRQGLPVEIIAEYEIWRRVRDPEGAEGWVHKTSLSGKRAVLITGAPHELRRERDDKSAVLAHLDAGSIGQLVSCTKDWCKVKFDSTKGYLHKTDFWGAYANEVFD